MRIALQEALSPCLECASSRRIQFLTAPAANLVKLPDSISFEQGARFGYLGTAYAASSRIWFTCSHGILNEVYHPTIDRAQVRSFGNRGTTTRKKPSTTRLIAKARSFIIRQVQE